MLTGRFAHRLFSGLVLYPDNDWADTFRTNGPWEAVIVDRTVLISRATKGFNSYDINPDSHAGYRTRANLTPVNDGLAFFCVDHVELTVGKRHLSWAIPPDHELPWPMIRPSQWSKIDLEAQFRRRLLSAHQAGLDLQPICQGVPRHVRKIIRDAWPSIVDEVMSL